MTLIRAFGLGTRQVWLALALAKDVGPAWLPRIQVAGAGRARALDITVRWLWMAWSLTVQRPGTHENSWWAFLRETPPSLRLAAPPTREVGSGP